MELRSVFVEVGAAADIQLAGPADVAVAKVVQGYGRLNQPLIESPSRDEFFGPERFPDLVALEEVTDVEMLNALEVERIVFDGWHESPASILD